MSCSLYFFSNVQTVSRSTRTLFVDVADLLRTCAYRGAYPRLLPSRSTPAASALFPHGAALRHPRRRPPPPSHSTRMPAYALSYSTKMPAYASSDSPAPPPTRAWPCTRTAPAGPSCTPRTARSRLRCCPHGGPERRCRSTATGPFSTSLVGRSSG